MGKSPSLSLSHTLTIFMLWAISDTLRSHTMRRHLASPITLPRYSPGRINRWFFSACDVVVAQRERDLHRSFLLNLVFFVNSRYLSWQEKEQHTGNDHQSIRSKKSSKVVIAKISISTTGHATPTTTLIIRSTRCERVRVVALTFTSFAFRTIFGDE